MPSGFPPTPPSPTHCQIQSLLCPVAASLPPLLVSILPFSLVPWYERSPPKTCSESFSLLLNFGVPQGIYRLKTLQTTSFPEAASPPMEIPSRLLTIKVFKPNGLPFLLPVLSF